MSSKQLQKIQIPPREGLPVAEVYVGEDKRTNERKQQALRLEAVRRSTGLNQKQFAERLGLTSRSYQNYAQAERDIPAQVFRRLLADFGVDPGWMWDGPGLLDPRRVNTPMVDDTLMARSIATLKAAVARNKATLSSDQEGYVLSKIYDFYARNERATSIDSLIDALMRLPR